MATKKSMEKAAQAWCKKDTEHLVMIPELAKEFARVLDRENIFSKIRRDKGLFISWQANIAMAFVDQYYYHEKKNGRKKYKNYSDIHTIANAAAENFLRLLIRAK